MKKAISLVLAVVFVCLSIAGCSKSARVDIVWTETEDSYVYRNWTVKKHVYSNNGFSPTDDVFEGCESLSRFTGFLLDYYSQLLGEDLIFGKDCFLCHAQDAENPTTYDDRIVLHLNMTNYDNSFSGLDYCKTVYQLGHELIHYAHNQLTDNSVSWFEEIVAEAMALHSLDYLEQHWDENEESFALDQSFKFYKMMIPSYRNDEIESEATNGLAECDTVEKLVEYNSFDANHKRRPEDDRPSHHKESLKLYEAISKDPSQVKELLLYHNYLNDDGVTFDFDRWQAESPSPLLEVLKDIQPVK